MNNANCLIDPRIDSFLKAFGVRPDQFFAKPGQIAEGVFTFDDGVNGFVTIVGGGGGNSVALDMQSPVQINEPGVGEYYLFGRESRIVVTLNDIAGGNKDDLLSTVGSLFADLPTVGGVRREIHPFGAGGYAHQITRNVTASAAGTIDFTLDLGWFAPKEGFVIDSERPVELANQYGTFSGDDWTANWQVKGVAIAKSLLPNDPPIPELNAWCQCKWPRAMATPKK